MIKLRHIFRMNAAKLPPSVPQNVTPPTIVGEPEVGETLFVGTGSWNDSVDPASKKFFLGVEFGASTDGLNGDTGFQQGQYEERIYEEGSFSLTFPNAPGPDGASHLERFLILATPKRLSDASTLLELYRPGDEWIEIWDENDLLYVGTPLTPVPGRQSITISGQDPTYLLKKTREFWGVFWNHAPRDVWEHYTSVWTAVIADDFSEAAFGGSANSGQTADNRWVYVNALDGPSTTVRIEGSGRIKADPDYAIQVGIKGSNPYDSWRVETEFTRSALGSGEYIRVGLWDVDVNAPQIYIEFKEKGTFVICWDEVLDVGSTFGGYVRVNTKIPTDPPGPFQVVVEGRERWIYFWVNQTLYGVLAMPFGPYNCVPFVSISSDSAFVDCRNLMLRRTQPYLMNGDLHGDYHINGVLPTGGLNARYFNDIQLTDITGGGAVDHGSYGLRVFNPAQVSQIAARQDGPLNFTSDDGQWWPDGTTSGKWWSVRWTGSIKLDLNSGDVLLRYTTMQEGARVWVGKTRFPEAYLDSWLRLPFSPDSGPAPGQLSDGTPKVGGSLKDHIGPDDDGNYHDAWYPILIEYGQRNIAGTAFKLEWSFNGGSSWEVVPAEKLSPYGIFYDQVRLDSHSEVLKTLADTFNLQARVDPRPLEHDAFPGEFVPRNRVGRDTNKVMDSNLALDYSTNINAETVADSILADGSGIADSSQTSQLTLEALLFDGLESRMMIMSEYESFGDVAHTELLGQRINSLLALRSSPWEEVNAAPKGGQEHEFIDAFPMTGDLDEFFWRPGDGVRISLPEIGVLDGSPRQIMGVTRNFVPEGLQAAIVSFRQRPRNLSEFMRLIQRRIANKGRNYQGQIVRTTGTAGSLSSPTIIPLPADLADIQAVEITVLTTPDDPMYVYVNGVKTNFPQIIYPGTYDITPYVARYNDGQNDTTTMQVELKAT